MFVGAQIGSGADPTMHQMIINRENIRLNAGPVIAHKEQGLQAKPKEAMPYDSLTQQEPRSPT